MPDLITVELPIPPIQLQPNGRTIWQIRQRYAREARQLANVRGRNARIAAGLDKPLRPPVYAALTFFFKTNRRHDEDNLTNSMKAYWDGLVDARVLIDDRMDMLHVQSITTFVDARRPRVVVNLLGGHEHLSALAQRLLDDLHARSASDQ